jgi:hypothetical protein
VGLHLTIEAGGGFAWSCRFDTHNDLRLAVDALSGGLFLVRRCSAPINYIRKKFEKCPVSATRFDLVESLLRSLAPLVKMG